MDSLDLRQETDVLADRDITAAVERLLACKQGVAAHLIDVSTAAGITTLSGCTDSLLARDRAEEIARAVRGVRGVVNAVDVRASGLPDATLRHDVEEALRQDAVAGAFDLSCTAREGVVMLLGEVACWSEKELALRLARGVRGVRGLEDHLRCRPAPADRPAAALAADIEERLAWDVHINGAQVQVLAHDNGAVELSGAVASAAEHHLALRAAWLAGATRVEAAALRVDPAAASAEVEGDKYLPKSDEALEQAIRTCCRHDARIGASQPDVEVRRGRVALRGAVGSLRARHAAEQVASAVVGVRRVDNYLRVRPAHCTADAELQRCGQAALQRDAYLHRHALEVVVSNGRVGLSGAVDSVFERQHAEQVVASLQGVVAIDNRLTVPAGAAFAEADHAACQVAYAEPLPGRPLGDAETKQRIRQQLYWTPGLHEQAIRVGLKRGRAILAGTVDTPLQRQLATLCAYEGGAQVVDNQLHVRTDAHD
ncbi:BON domain-containing protein [Hymenobacter sp. 15J16-1T3B]|uniref:BON domain-containing protein n=1 Tax=Hymenobacter sp. 15J16-1T3B TaxID=2886941 RepID=UPI001D116A29|nr:BON domain-containing protein [Hymenobacter sp. 15J16-1T3B]MCC3156674.1 BON domain-containing protein [Hymenobacter sp. 15J16-1T3B]